MQIEDDPTGRTRPRHGELRSGGWRFTTPAVLLLLTQAPAHGYELLARLGEVFPRSGRLPDPGAFYRLLRGLERDGAVTSSWETAEAGPARRVYAINDEGREQLEGWAVSIERDLEAMRAFLRAYRRPRSNARPRAKSVTAIERTRLAERRPATSGDADEPNG
jgi:DNA-binding PadR family transcriptional regulator